MMFTVAGTQAYIGGQLTMGASPLVASDFADQAWVPIGGLEALGTLGQPSEVSSYQQLAVDDPAAPARARKEKAAVDAGTMEMIAASDHTDAGQIALIAAEGSSATFAFKIELPDAPQGGTPSMRLFTALVVNASDVLDQASSVFKLAASLAIDSNIVRVSAAP